MRTFVGKTQFFGKHLIDKALVTEEEVLEALEMQHDKSQSFEKVALRLGIMSSKETFKVLTYKADSDLSFEEIALKLELINREQAERVVTHIENLKPFIGLTLVKMGKLSVEDMERELDEYEKIVELHQKLAENLHNISLFRHLSERTLESLAYITETKHFGERQRIINEGDTAGSFYCVHSGSLVVTKNNVLNGSQPIYISSIGENEVFGESCIFECGIRTANVTTETPTTLFSFRRDLFIDFIKNHPKDSISIFIYFVQQLMSRLESTDRDLVFERRFGLCQEKIDELVKDFFD
ncbi:MAG: cyclic nucleotide-binding domain-containing protein [Nitrospirae bacterium]|nr:cyclic nucleotide-binding domain-containing protein [Nitrospirota bacterium]